MAWAEKRSNGSYRGMYRDRKGTRHAVRGSFASKQKATVEAAKKEDEVRGLNSDPRAARMLWSDWAQQWWEGRKVEPSTRKSDRPRYQRLLDAWGTWRLGDITRADVQTWVDELADRDDLAPATAVRYYHLLSACMRSAVLAGKIPASPCVSIELPTVAPPDERYLTRDEFHDIHAMIDGQRHKLLVRLLVGTGMRWGEAVALHRHRVDLDAKRVEVIEAYDGESGLIKPYPKGKKKRSVPITDDLADELRAWFTQHPSTGRCAAEHAKGSKCRSPLVLTGDDGQVVDYFHFEKMVWRPALALTNVGHATIHDLRHTYASWLIQDEIRLEQVSVLLGHASLATTQRYAHLADSQWDQVRGVLDRHATFLPPSDEPDTATEQAAEDDTGRSDEVSKRWGRRDLNPRPRDYERHTGGPAWSGTNRSDTA